MKKNKTKLKNRKLWLNICIYRERKSDENLFRNSILKRKKL